jgi:hypothetical protein
LLKRLLPHSVDAVYVAYTLVSNKLEERKAAKAMYVGAVDISTIRLDIIMVDFLWTSKGTR